MQPDRAKPRSITPSRQKNRLSTTTCKACGIPSTPSPPMPPSLAPMSCSTYSYRIHFVFVAFFVFFVLLPASGNAQGYKSSRRSVSPPIPLRVLLYEYLIAIAIATVSRAWALCGIAHSSAKLQYSRVVKHRMHSSKAATCVHARRYATTAATMSPIAARRTPCRARFFSPVNVREHPGVKSPLAVSPYRKAGEHRHARARHVHRHLQLLLEAQNKNEQNYIVWLIFKIIMPLLQ